MLKYKFNYKLLKIINIRKIAKYLQANPGVASILHPLKTAV